MKIGPLKPLHRELLDLARDANAADERELAEIERRMAERGQRVVRLIAQDLGAAVPQAQVDVLTEGGETFLVAADTPPKETTS
jgi:Holliday junction resolvase